MPHNGDLPWRRIAPEFDDNDLRSWAELTNASPPFCASRPPYARLNNIRDHEPTGRKRTISSPERPILVFNCLLSMRQFFISAAELEHELTNCVDQRVDH